MNWNVNERVAGDEGTLHIPSAIRIKLSIGGRLHYHAVRSQKELLKP